MSSPRRDLSFIASSSRSFDDSSPTFSESANTLNTNARRDDLESLSLLHQIFPDESIDDLRRLHQERLLHASAQKSKKERDHNLKAPPFELEDDFLRLPIQIAVRRYHEGSGKWEYQYVEDLQQRLWMRQPNTVPRGGGWVSATHVLPRHAELGLGITLAEGAGGREVRIYAVNVKGADIKAGDVLVGVNGYALAEIAAHPQQSLLRQTVAFLKTCPSPVVFHLLKAPPPNSTVSLLDTTLDESMHVQQLEAQQEPFIHPFAKVLSDHGFLTTHNSPKEEEMEITQKLQQFTERARQWEFSNSYRIQASTFQLLPSFEQKPVVVPQYAQSPARSTAASSIASSISHSSANSGNSHANNNRSSSYYPGWRGLPPPVMDDIFIPLMGVRKALSVRILNHFVDGDYVAYTIWVHDIESGREWYAPLRYFSDFCDLRAAALQFRPDGISAIPFPSQGFNYWSLFGSRPSEANDSDATRETKCRQLEQFLRTLCTMIYTHDLHPSVAEVAIHVQSFLGCDAALDPVHVPLRSLQQSAAATTTVDGVQHSVDQWRLRTLLKRQFQLYVYRIFLLEATGKLVDRFVDTARAKGPTLKEIEVMQAKSRSALKKHAMEELKQIQAVMDRLQELVLEGCVEDFRVLAQDSGLDDFLTGKGGDAYLDRLVREAVREQVEIEVYLPLRGTTSRMLVNAWRHEDMEVSFKVQELRKRPHDYFRIPVEDDENWHSVSGLLKNVSLSTLPCAKLRAIVEAATEISRLYKDQKANIEDDENEEDDNDEPKHLGADDFLPIFIFCVIRAEMERPCALCALLRTLCDPINKMGEVGYYLASFEAAITHIREMDLSETREEMFSFLSIPLSDGSFG